MATQSDPRRVLREIRRFRDLRDVDLLLLQEVEHRSGHLRAIAAEMADAFGFYYAFAGADLTKNGGQHGLATLSRYPLSDLEVIRVKQFDLRFRKRCRIAFAATADTPLGLIRTINVHLDSRINSRERLEQLAPVLRSAGNGPRKCVIGGDFNTADVRWMRRWIPLPYFARQGHATRKMLEGVGFSTAFVATGPTFKYLGLKLDWIFVRGFRTLAMGVEPIEFSDHRAVWVQITPEASRNPSR